MAVATTLGIKSETPAMAVARVPAARTQQCYSFPQSVIGISSVNSSQSEFKRKSKVKLASRFLGSGSRWNALAAYQLESNSRHQIKSSFPRSTSVVARLFGPAIFQASKLKVLFLGTHEEKHPGHLPRTYTLTHSDLTAKLTLAISQTINKDQLRGWYNRLQRDEVIAQWKKSQGKMSLHVHCHISGGHWLLDAIAMLRFYIFRKELPMVLEAFRHGDRALLEKHPELETALVWVYFHSNVKEFKRVECWGSLAEACKADKFDVAMHPPLTLHKHPMCAEGPGGVWCNVDVVEFSYYGAPAATPKEQLYTELVEGLRGSDQTIGSGSQFT